MSGEIVLRMFAKVRFTSTDHIIQFPPTHTAQTGSIPTPCGVLHDHVVQWMRSSNGQTLEQGRCTERVNDKTHVIRFRFAHVR